MTNRIISIALFETCIGLRHTNPQAGLEHFCRVVSRDSGHAEMAQILLRQRILAERRATRRLKSIPSLNAIYEDIRVFSEWHTDVDSLRIAEGRFHLERAVCRPGIHEALSTLRASGCKIVYLANTVVAATKVQGLLEQFNLWHAEDAICLNHEAGTDFPARQAFQHFLGRFEVSPGSWTHYGNGARTERAVVRALGGGYFEFSCTAPNRFEVTDPTAENGAFLKASAITALQRNTRLTAGNPENPALSRIFADVAAPLLTAYVQDLLDQAKNQQLHTLYFLGRNGQILKMIADRLPHKGTELRHLDGGYPAWLLPSLAENPEQAVDLMAPVGTSRTPSEILSGLGIDPDAIRETLARTNLLEKLHLPLKRIDSLQLRDSLREPQILELIAAEARRRRTLMLAYLEQEGLTRPRGWALVDLGWTGRCQRALRIVLRSAGHRGEIKGYYLGLNDHHCDFSETGPARGFVVDQNRLPRHDPVRTLFRYQSLIEELFTIADHGNTLYYEEREGQIVPVFEPFENSSPQRDILLAQHLICKQFARLWKEYREDASDTAILKRVALRNLALFFNYPDTQEVEAIRWLRGNPEKMDSREPPLAKPYSLLDLLAITRHRALHFRMPSHSRWKEGSIAITSPSVRTCISAASKVQSLWHQSRRAAGETGHC